MSHILTYVILMITFPLLTHEPSIIAVHGLGEDSFSTWTDKSSGKLWLEDFLPLSEYGKRARVMTFGYDAEVFIRPLSLAQKNETFVSAEQLLNNIKDSRRSSEARLRHRHPQSVRTTIDWP